MNSLWLHPSLILFVGALLLPLVPAAIKKGYLILVPTLLFVRILFMLANQGDFGHVNFLDWELRFGRVDPLSSVFGVIMGLMCIIGTLYGLHVKENAQHVASWVYVGGSIGAIYAGDFITLFLFWEVMAFSSVFLVWFRRRPESLAAGYRYLLVHVAGGLALLAGILLNYQATGSWAFDHLAVEHPTPAMVSITGSVDPSPKPQMSRSLAVGMSLRCLPSRLPSGPNIRAVQYRVPPSRSITPATRWLAISAAKPPMLRVSGPGTAMAAEK